MKKTASEEVVARVPESRREFLRRMAATGFVLPAVATFSMSGLMARPALAGGSNMTS